MGANQVKAYGTDSAKSSIKDMVISRRALLPSDVEIDIMYCGICHSDLHAARNEWGGSTYPMVPGHEIVGRIIGIGSEVTKFKVGDIGAIGCIVDSCGHCHYCNEGEEQYCESGCTIVFDSPDKHLGGTTYGGFSERIVCKADYVLTMPEFSPLADGTSGLAAAAPILCAGITVFSPLRHWKVRPGMKIGIIGMGGLGHMAIKIAKAMGAQVTVFTTSEGKIEDARRLGADAAILSTDKATMRKQRGFDLILDTVSAKHDINKFFFPLKVNGSLVLVGLPSEPLEIAPFRVVNGRKSFSGSSIGGIAETQEVIDFCAKHNITADIELIKPSQINEAFERLERGDVKYRFVIDMKREQVTGSK